MVKIIAIPVALSLALGALLGYHLQKLESQPVTKNDSGDAIAAIPKQVDPLKVSRRSALILKYELCTNSTESGTLARLDDTTLNDLVYQVCTAKK